MFETLKLEIWCSQNVFDPLLASHRWSGWAVPQWISGKESHLFFMTFTPGGPAFLGRDDVGVTANANNLSECIRDYC